MKTLYFVTLCALFVPAVVGAQPVACKDRTFGPERTVSMFCAGENYDFTSARVDFWESTGVWPRDFPACEVRPIVNFQTHDLIVRSCNQNPVTGRDLHSCGSPNDGGGYGMAFSHQSHITAISRWYRYIQLQKFFWWCTGQSGAWPWWSVPREWS